MMSASALVILLGIGWMVLRRSKDFR